MYPDHFNYLGNRGISFHAEDQLRLQLWHSIAPLDLSDLLG
jgi:hypothetical protein